MGTNSLSTFALSLIVIHSFQKQAKLNEKQNCLSLDWQLSCCCCWCWGGEVAIIAHSNGDHSHYGTNFFLFLWGQFLFQHSLISHSYFISKHKKAKWNKTAWCEIGNWAVYWCWVGKLLLLLIRIVDHSHYGTTFLFVFMGQLTSNIRSFSHSHSFQKMKKVWKQNCPEF